MHALWNKTSRVWVWVCIALNVEFTRKSNFIITRSFVLSFSSLAFKGFPSGYLKRVGIFLHCDNSETTMLVSHATPDKTPSDATALSIHTRAMFKLVVAPPEIWYCSASLSSSTHLSLVQGIFEKLWFLETTCFYSLFVSCRPTYNEARPKDRRDRSRYLTLGQKSLFIQGYVHGDII